MCESKTVKVEVEIPGNIYEALKLIAEACHLSVEELLRWGARSEIECFISGPYEAYMEHFVVPAVKRVEALRDLERARLAVRP